MDLTSRLRSVIRAALGLPEDLGAPPDLVRLGLYRAEVVSASSDGSKLDVRPEDKRFAPASNVPVRVGIPGAVAVVVPGAIVLLGWERGDPARPYCTPMYEAGATVSKLALNAQALELGGNTYALPQWDLAATAIKAFATAAKASTTDPTLVTAATALELAFTSASNFKSLIAKNG